MNETIAGMCTLFRDEQGEEAREWHISCQVATQCFEFDRIYLPLNESELFLTACVSDDLDLAYIEETPRGEQRTPELKGIARDRISLFLFWEKRKTRHKRFLLPLRVSNDIYSYTAPLYPTTWLDDSLIIEIEEQGDDTTKNIKHGRRISPFMKVRSSLLRQSCMDSYRSEFISTMKREELDEYQPLVHRYYNNVNFMIIGNQLIRDLISRLPTSLQSQSTMIGAFAAHFSQVDYGIQKKIEEFCLHYQSSLALNYYTKDMFFYQVINQILRQKREDSFYTYRHATVDIMRCLWRPLPSEEDSVSLTLYRGQLMTVLEMDKLKGNVGELVGFSSFMSTTFNRSIAEAFSGHGLNDTPNLVSVILKIYLDTGQPMRPYALVPNSAEEEVLFSPGTKFMLMSCRKLHDNGRLWLIELKAISEEQQEQLVLTYGETLMLLTSAKGWPTSVVVVPIEIT